MNPAETEHFTMRTVIIEADRIRTGGQDFTAEQPFLAPLPAQDSTLGWC